jgi:hypothetical protein
MARVKPLDLAVVQAHQTGRKPERFRNMKGFCDAKVDRATGATGLTIISGNARYSCRAWESPPELAPRLQVGIKAVRWAVQWVL